MTFSLTRHVAPFLVLVLFLDLCVDTGFSHSTPARDGHVHHHGGGCSHSHDHDHDHDHDHRENTVKMKLPEELAEEEDMRLCGFGPCLHHDHESTSALSGFALWVNALGCSLLVSLASLICLILLPVMFVQGKPAKWFVDALALFGVSFYVGDAFLHQLPHAFGGGHSHSSDHHESHAHHDHDHSPSHSHSLQDLSVGLSVLGNWDCGLPSGGEVGAVCQENSPGSNTWGHHHHHHAGSKKLKDEDGPKMQMKTHQRKSPAALRINLSVRFRRRTHFRWRIGKTKQVEKSSSLVFGYLNLFSDGVHNFTDGMALGSAFLIYGSVGGWSRTMFLLYARSPSRGDFGILVRSGFTESKALFFNSSLHLSHLLELPWQVLVWGNEPGQSSLIEVVRIYSGGFIYIAVAGVLAEMNNSGQSTLRNTVCHLISLMLGMGVALGISLLE
ncbi:hypothetical protein Bca52824_083465 [Brassica carinata]|uniref:IAA-alanine resistance protein 1 n=1 Tax=Brassica carinata TaxID=52824 RepID=A0A8X7PPH3_BRACI|nr:hypothetical protein Bca52824_083465 [Brassica carinata]